MNPQLINYIKQNKAANVPDQTIIQNLRNVGWQDHDIFAGMGFVSTGAVMQPQNNPAQPTQNSTTNQNPVQNSQPVYQQPQNYPQNAQTQQSNKKLVIIIVLLVVGVPIIMFIVGMLVFVGTIGLAFLGR